MKPDNGRAKIELRQKIDAILEMMALGRITQAEAASQMAKAGAPMPVIARVMQKVHVRGDREKNWRGDGWSW